jgi:competence protein ComEC
MKDRFFVLLLSGFIAGVGMRSFFDFGWAMAGLFVFFGVIFLLVFLNHKILFFISVIFLGMALGVARYEIKDARQDFSWLDERVGARVELNGVVVEEPDERENYTRLIVEVEEEAEGLTGDGARMLIYASHYPVSNYGDRVKLKGLLKKPSNFVSDSGTGSDFSWIDYLAKDDIYYEMFYPQIEQLPRSDLGKIKVKEKLFAIKGKFLSALERILPEPHSAFMGGVTIGAKQSIPKTLQEDFRRTGVIHIIVLSGYNITIVADVIMRIFGFLPHFVGLGLGSLGIILFVIMTGASATAVRASIMALLVLLARSTGRIYTITRALFIAGFLMVLQNPKILRFDSSFQLSFLATLALIYFAPHIEKKLKFVPKKFKMREMVTATVSAQILVLPLLLYKTGLFSVVSLPVNILILAFIPITMALGFLTGITGMFAGTLFAPISFLSIPLGWTSYAFLQYELWIVKIFAKLPFASFNLSAFPLWLMWLIYAFLAMWIYKKKKEEGKLR